MATCTRRAPCEICGDKAAGIFKCEGCLQVFCPRHVIEHRELLNQQFEEIAVQYDRIQDAINERKANQIQSLPFLQRIDQWERQSIEKIRKAANDARQQVKSNGKIEDTVSRTFRDLTEELQKARADGDYLEKDLQTWTTKLERLRSDINTVKTSSINIYEDPTKLLIGQICVNSLPTSPANNECFDDFIGSVAFKDKNRVAYHCGDDTSGAYVRGKTEYSKGAHKIRFIMRKKTADFVMCFNVISATVPKLAISSKRNYFKYGWQTDDSEDNSDDWRKNKSTFRDLRGETTMQLELTIDCDQQKISYFNERTKNSREMNIDIRKCPLPWRLEFYLFDVDDRIQFVS